VFVVANARSWQSAAAVLFERESVRRDTPPRREKGQEVAGTIAARFKISRNNHEECVPTVAETLIASDHKGPGHNRDHNFIAQPITFGAQMSEPQTDVDLVQTLQANNPMAVAQPVAFTRCDNGQDAAVDVTPTMRCGSNYSAHLAVAQPVALGTDCYNGAITGEVAATIGTPGSSVNASGPTVMQAVDVKQVQWASGGGQVENDTAQALRAGAEYNYQFARVAMQVRRLTPVECERLQGFPDGYTNIPWRKKDEAPDGPRYKALGNSMAVPVMRWIGKRIQQVSEL
jgi:DNA (cytosine-5)-methyltransferase 1